LPHFCPPCKRQLEEGIPEGQHSLDTVPVQQMSQRWHAIFVELAEELGYPEPPPVISASSSTAPANSEEARDRWRKLLAVFGQAFPAAPDSEEVRNWNSVHGRKLYYRGTVRRGKRQFVVTLEAQAELNEDLITTKRAPTGQRELLFLDWQERLVEGQQVLFIAFPNPSVNERDKVNRIVRLLNLPGASDDEAGKSQDPNLGLPVVKMDSIPHFNREVEESSIDAPGPIVAEDVSAAPAPEIASPTVRAPPATCPACPAEAREKSPCRPPGISVGSPQALSAEENSRNGDSKAASPSSAFAEAGFGSFADLMMWSEDGPEAERQVTERSPSLRCRAAPPLAVAPSPLPPPGPSAGIAQARPRGPPASSLPNSPLVPASVKRDSPEGSPPLVPLGPAKIPVPAIPAKGLGRGKGSPTTPGCIPAKAGGLICPRSPYAAYFDD